MIQVFYFIFWITLSVIFYNYIGYGLLLWMINSIKRLFGAKKVHHDMDADSALLPAVTLVVAAYNEEAVIEEKITNCLALDYPKEKLSMLFVTDGSSDNTPEIISRHREIELLHRDERNGKTAALNRAMQEVNTPITVFCDANTILNKEALRKIVAHYQDPGTGGVAGEKRIYTENDTHAAVASEGLYWKYESALKRLDAELYTVVGAAGELFSIRTALWQPVEPEVILDDFVISLRINIRGYRMAYEPGAYATELPSASIREEKKRKIRIAAGAFQAMGLLKPVFNCIKHPLLFFQFFSHRVLRWTLVPLSLPLLLIANIMLVILGGSIFFKIVLMLQLLFYILALSGAFLTTIANKFKILKVCHYLLFMNYSVYLGFVRYMRGKQSVVWEKAGRKILASCL